MSKRSSPLIKIPQGSDAKFLHVQPLFATVDIGSNNIRLALYYINPRGELVKIDKDHIPEKTKFTTKLGEELSTDNRVLKRKSLKEASAALKSISVTLQKYGIPPSDLYFKAGATAALREVRGTDQGDEDIASLKKEFHPYSFEIMEEEEEAQAVYEAAAGDRHSKLVMASLTVKQSDLGKPYAAVLATGGASTEIIILDKAGNIISKHILFQGIHTMDAVREKPGGSAKTAGDDFSKALVEACIPNSLKMIFTLSGAYRALREDVCAPRFVHMKGHHEICRKLAATAQKDEAYFAAHESEDVRERAHYFTLAAEALGRMVKHTRASMVVFLNRSVVDAFADRLFENLKRRQTVLDGARPSFPSDPAQGPRA